MSGAVAAQPDIFSMSDEDFAKMAGPPTEGEQETVEVVEETGTKTEENSGENEKVEKTQEELDAEAAAAEAAKKAGETEEDDKTVGANAEDKTKTGEDDGKVEGNDKSKDESDADKAKTEQKEPEKKPDAASPGSEQKPETAAATSLTPPTNEEAQSFFMKVMAPFKANGKLIQLKSPDEVIQLMQMGANYTRKLQDIQPHRKTLLMLEKNGLLDEGKLSFLVDLDRKDPEAIKKLVKDAGIDPMDLNTDDEPAYLPGSHAVSDEEAGFRQVLDELVSSDTGKETVQIINTGWDDASKQALWQSPEIMSIIHEQRETGVYDLISAEVDRRKMLGQIPPSTPFLQAYKLAGDELAKAGAFDQLDKQPTVQTDTPESKPEPTVVAVRTEAPKSEVTNGDQASAASVTRTTSRKAEKLVNPLAMSDEEFLTNFNNRL